MHEAVVATLVERSRERLREARSAILQVPDALGTVRRSDVDAALAVTEAALRADVEGLRSNVAAAHALIRRCRFPREEHVGLFGALADLAFALEDLDQGAAAAEYPESETRIALPPQHLVPRGAIAGDLDALEARLAEFDTRLVEIEAQKAGTPEHADQDSLVDYVADHAGAQSAVALELSRQGQVDVRGLSHAVEGLGRVVASFVATVAPAVARVTSGLRGAARRLGQAARRVVGAGSTAVQKAVAPKLMPEATSAVEWRSKIYLSYRSDDITAVERIHALLAEGLGERRLFLDQDFVPSGRDFVGLIRRNIEASSTLLAIIGPNWTESRDANGFRSVMSATDTVRIEIATALRLGIRVIPVLLDATRPPKPELLPEDIRGIAFRHAFEVHQTSLRDDMDRLIRFLKEFDPSPEPEDPDSAGTVSIASLLPERSNSPGRIKIDAKFVYGAPADATGGGWFLPGAGKTEWFKDHEFGPEMVVVPAGSFMMGSTFADDERPPHTVSIGHPFAVGRYALTFDEWEVALVAGGVIATPDDEGWGRGRRPVINVSWSQAVRYCEWLSAVSGRSYRLPSEAEWEYFCRAGGREDFWWGDTINSAQANYNANYSFKGEAKGEYRQRTVPVDSFEPNPWGLYQVHGNVWEWCSDTWHENYLGAPIDGSSWVSADSSLRSMRGGSWDYGPIDLRSSYRDWKRPEAPNYNIGFRVVCDLIGQVEGESH